MYLTSFPPPSCCSPPPSVAVRFHSTSMYYQILTSSPGAERRPPGRCQYLPPASLRCSYLHPTPHAYGCCRFPRPVAPPLPPSSFTQVPVSSGGLPIVGHSVSLVSPPLPPCVLLQLLEYSGSWFLYQVAVFVRGQGARTPPLPGNRPPWSPWPPCHLDPICIGWRWCVISLEIVFMRACWCHQRVWLAWKTEGLNHGLFEYVCI